MVVATPTYLKRRGRPKAPGDLAKHEVLHFGAGSDHVTLHLDHLEAHMTPPPWQLDTP